MKNLVTTFKDYSEFVLENQEYRTPGFFKDCLADAVVNYWRMLLFIAPDDDLDDAAQAEEVLIDSINSNFTIAEKKALQKAAKLRLKQQFPEIKEIDPEDESHNRELRFLTFIATGRFEDMDLL